MVDLVGSTNGLDTTMAPESSMSDANVTEIMVRLERLDAGQRFVIEQIGALQAGNQKSHAALDLLAARVQRLEWDLETHEKRIRPWRSLVFTVVAAWVTAVGTFLILHR